MSHTNQNSLLKQKPNHNLSHGGSLRSQRRGRRNRPLSCKHPLHVVFKINRSALKGHSLRTLKVFQLCQNMIRIYAKKFFIQIEQVSIQNNHIHLLIRTTRRSLYLHFFRVVAGQIAQTCHRFGLCSGHLKKRVTDTPEEGGQKTEGKKISLWKHRPFSRIVKGRRAYIIIKNYIQLNEMEATGKIAYQINRLRGMTAEDLKKLWS
jgi:putative transposase